MNYKYLIDNQEVFPVNNGLNNVTYEKSLVSSIAFQKKMDGTIIFDAVNSQFDFKAQEYNDATKELTLIIKRRCNGVWEKFIKLYFTVAEGEFDDDTCTFKVQARSREDFPKDIPVNIINLQSRSKDGTTGYTTGLIAEDRLFPQIFYFDKTILLVAQTSNPAINGIISDFFQINPDTVSSEALPGITNYWKRMFFASLSDIQEPVPSSPALFEFITFRELMEDLNVLFDVYWFVDANNNLRIEHRKYFEGIVGLDLTQSQYEKDLIGTNRYIYDLEGFPKIEKIFTAGSAQYAQITYGFYANITRNKVNVTKQTKKIRTDWCSIRYFGGSSSDDGLFLFACDAGSSLSTPTMTTGTYVGPGLDGQNDKLTPDYLFKNLHTYGRYDKGALFESRTIFQPNYPQGILHAGGFTTESLAPIIVQDEINFKLCCDVEFDTRKAFKTSMGEGYLEKASFNMQTEYMRAQLRYRAPIIKFKPTDLPSLRAWYRTDLGLDSFTTPSSFPGPYDISSWTDFSGNSLHATQSNALNRPQWSDVLGSYQGIIFTPNQWLETPSFKLFPNKRGTIFILYKASAIDSLWLISTENGNPLDQFFNLGLFTGQLVSNLIVMPQIIFNSSALYTFTRPTNTQFFGRHNSINVKEYNPDIPQSNPATIPNVDITANPLIIGSNSLAGGAESGSVNIKEIIIFDEVLTPEEIEKVEVYLARKHKEYYEINFHN